MNVKLLASSRRVVVCCWISFVLALTACGGGGGTSASSTPPATPTTPTSASFTFSAASLDFGSVPMGAPKALSISMSNNGSAAVTVTQLQSTAGDFAVTGVTLPLTLNPQQTANGTVTFNPSVSGLISGNINAVNSAGTLGTLGLKGTGVAPAAHSVSLSWTISTSPSVVAYNIYRSTSIRRTLCQGGQFPHGQLH